MGHTVDNDGPCAWRALDDLVTGVVDVRAQIAALQARETQLLADAVGLVAERTAERRVSQRIVHTDLALREVSAELGAAMRISDRTVQRRMGDADALVTRLPAVLAAWQAGRIDHGHAAAILDAGMLISDDGTRARFERLALAAAECETPGRLRPLVHAIAAQLDPAAVIERARRNHADRRVRLIDLGDDMAQLRIDTNATLAHAIYDRLTQMAHAVKATPAHAMGSADDVEAGTGADGGAASHGCADADADADPEAEAEAETEIDTDTDTDTGSARDADGERVVVVTGPSGREHETAPRGSSCSQDPDRASGDPHSETDVDELEPDARTMDQLRTDIVADLLLAGAPAAHGHGDALGSIAGHVQVTVPVLTLAGVTNEPALLAGSGPIDPDTARRLAAGAPGWDRVMYHPHSGEPLAVDRYRPHAALQRFLDVRDERCRTPGCTQPVWRCDVDHTIDAAHGGATCPANNAHFCRRHHTVKPHTAWTVRQLGAGVLEWTSPTGRRYLDKPPATVRFVPTDCFSVIPDDTGPPF